MEYKNEKKNTQNPNKHTHSQPAIRSKALNRNKNTSNTTNNNRIANEMDTGTH